MTYLLAVDVGNTNVSVGAFEGDQLQATWRLSTDSRRTEDEHFLLFDGLLRTRAIDRSEIEAVAMCSVVPPVTETVRRALDKLSGRRVFVVGQGTRTGIKVTYDRPQDVGTDRIVDALAALTIYGAPAVVVDMGTATVFDAVTEDGEYIGGALSPGLALSANALYESTSLLRRVELIAPESAIGRNTTMALQSGLVYGYVELVEGMVRRFREELDPDDPDRVSVIATGGLATVLAAETDAFTVVDPDLTLQGLRLAWELNA